MENCEADNIPEKRFLQKLLKRSLSKKHLHKGLSKNSCSAVLLTRKILY